MMELSHVYGGAVVLLLVVALLAVLRRCWRRRRRRAVCWFCHEPQPGGSREAGWSCVSCHQYNGFTEVLQRQGSLQCQLILKVGFCTQPSLGAQTLPSQ